MRARALFNLLLCSRKILCATNIFKIIICNYSIWMHNEWMNKPHTPPSPPTQPMIFGRPKDCLHGALPLGGSRVECQDWGLKFESLMWLFWTVGWYCCDGEGRPIITVLRTAQQGRAEVICRTLGSNSLSSEPFPSNMNEDRVCKS